jgi:hypothetical protein
MRADCCSAMAVGYISKMNDISQVTERKVHTFTPELSNVCNVSWLLQQQHTAATCYYSIQTPSPTPDFAFSGVIYLTEVDSFPLI